MKCEREKGKHTSHQYIFLDFLWVGPNIFVELLILGPTSGFFVDIYNSLLKMHLARLVRIIFFSYYCVLHEPDIVTTAKLQCDKQGRFITSSFEIRMCV